VSDKQREAIALRTITVSAHSALNKANDDEAREHIRDRAHGLLAELEAVVIRDGADAQILDAIERERRRLFD